MVNGDQDIDEEFDWQSNDKRTIIFLGTEVNDYNLPSIIESSDRLKTPISTAFGPIKEIRLFTDTSPKFATVTFQYNRSIQQCVVSNQPMKIKIEVKSDDENLRNEKSESQSEKKIFETCDLHCFRYRLGDDESTRENRTIFIEKLNKSVSKKDLSNFFGKFGTITMVRIFPDDCQGLSDILTEFTRSEKLKNSRFAYITFARRGPVVSQVRIKSHTVPVRNKDVKECKVNVEYYVYAHSDFKRVMNPVLQLFSPATKLNASDVYNSFGAKVAHNPLFG